ncbi:MAG: O-antigen ligase family protein [Planctomycetia bacterium]|nr:O-antigen ligase family protein [Planctomycetia bacterium]
MKTQNKVHKVIFGLSLILFLYIELLTLRRSTWVGMGIGFFLWVILMQGKLNRKMKSYIIGVLVVISGVVSMMYSEQMFERISVFSYFTDRSTHSDIVITSSIDARFSVAKYFIDIFKENPLRLLWGYGFMSAPMRYEYTGAHNQFLDVLHDSGIIGLIIFLWLVYSILKILWKHSRLSDEWQPIYYSMFFGTVSLIVSGLTGGFFTISHTFGSFVGFYLSLLSVICASTYQLNNKLEINKDILTAQY